MKRIPKSLLAACAVGLTTAGVAHAAASPTVATGRATTIAKTSVILNGTVNPNGNETGYVFQYGVTSAYGESTNSHSAGTGTKAVAVHIAVLGLTPGTTYHYHVVALSKAGSGAGADRTFTTSGPPPAAVITGPAVKVGQTTATTTASINPEGAATTWAVQYGLTATYGAQTIPPQGPLTPVINPLPVSTLLSALAPATLFHYRFVAYHNGNIVSAGQDATFFTEPRNRPRPNLTVHTKPGRARHKPYAYTTSGKLGGAGFIPAASRCSGSVNLKYYLGNHRIGTVSVPVGPDCSFSAQNSFRGVHATTPATITIKAHFNGNGYIAPVDRTNSVTAG